MTLCVLEAFRATFLPGVFWMSPIFTKDSSSDNLDMSTLSMFEPSRWPVGDAAAVAFGKFKVWLVPDIWDVVACVRKRDRFLTSIFYRGRNVRAR